MLKHTAIPISATTKTASSFLFMVVTLSNLVVVRRRPIDYLHLALWPTVLLASGQVKRLANFWQLRLFRCAAVVNLREIYIDGDVPALNAIQPIINTLHSESVSQAARFFLVIRRRFLPQRYGYCEAKQSGHSG
jgi:hypothetical protein